MTLPSRGPGWLEIARARLDAARSQLPEPTWRYACWLLLGLERSRFAETVVWVTTAGGLRLIWQRGPRWLLLLIEDPSGYRYRRIGPGLEEPVQDGAGFDTLRGLAAWLLKGTEP